MSTADSPISVRKFGNILLMGSVQILGGLENLRGGISSTEPRRRGRRGHPQIGDDGLGGDGQLPDADKGFTPFGR